MALRSGPVTRNSRAEYIDHGRKPRTSRSLRPAQVCCKRAPFSTRSRHRAALSIAPPPLGTRRPAGVAGERCSSRACRRAHVHRCRRAAGQVGAGADAGSGTFQGPGGGGGVPAQAQPGAQLRARAHARTRTPISHPLPPCPRTGAPETRRATDRVGRVANAVAQGGTRLYVARPAPTNSGGASGGAGSRRPAVVLVHQIFGLQQRVGARARAHTHNPAAAAKPVAGAQSTRAGHRHTWATQRGSCARRITPPLARPLPLPSPPHPTPRACACRRRALARRRACATTWRRAATYPSRPTPLAAPPPPGSPAR